MASARGGLCTQERLEVAEAAAAADDLHRTEAVATSGCGRQEACPVYGRHAGRWRSSGAQSEPSSDADARGSRARGRHVTKGGRHDDRWRRRLLLVVLFEYLWWRLPC
jgi:hypothetical protein